MSGSTALPGAPSKTRSAWIGVGAVLALSIALIWPAFINGGPLIFFDTLGYLDQGQSGVRMITERLSPPVLAVSDSASAAAAPITGKDASFLRSIVYPAFTYLASLGPFGFYGVALAQSLIVVTLVAIIAGREAVAAPSTAFIAAGVGIMLTSAPWIISTIMPDIFAAVAILSAMIMAARLDRLGVVGWLFVFGAATLATLSHYGHPPLYLAVASAALLVLLVQARLTVSAVGLAVGPLAVSMLISLGVSSTVFDEQSVIPKRMPLLLARSMEDGPALWHLQKHCDDYHYAVCTLWEDDIPSDLGTLLWSEDGLLKKPTDAQMDRIRQEEMLILKRALLEYPLQQGWSFFGNAIRQTWMIGMGDISWGRVIRDDDGRFVREDSGPQDISWLDETGWVQKSVVLLSLIAIAVWAVRDGLRTGDRERALLVVALVGLGANAAIFGGLSAPVDRYQARVIWIIPLLAGLFWLARRTAAARQGHSLD